MSLNEIVDMIWIPVLVCGISVVYAIKLWTSCDPRCVRSKSDNRDLKDPKAYARTAAKLLFLMAGGSLVMAGLLFINELAATIESIVVVIVFFILWKKMDGKYGPI